ncbi:Transmembrane protease serine 6 [Exaiptasia diaphana]|nr:Transmembrane protease serine 6 [Exaiptasia diaphana]
MNTNILLTLRKVEKVQKRVKCGTKVRGKQRIVGGSIARRGSWPWQVAVGKRSGSNPFCGGSIIAPNWIVTAAHCFRPNPSPQHYIVTAGEHNLRKKERDEQVMEVEKIIRHPNYNELENHKYDNDIALMKLKRSIKYNAKVRPVCLPSRSFPAGTNCYVTGWGRVQEKKVGGSSILRQARVPLVSEKECRKYNRLTSRMLCAGFKKGDEVKCGTKVIGKQRIIGGSIAKKGSWPWQVAVGKRNGTNQFCGGSIIVPNWIVTAAHCFQPNPNSSRYIVTAGKLSELTSLIKFGLIIAFCIWQSSGQHNIRREEGDKQVMEIEEIFLHPNYSRQNDDYDIALMKLKQNVTYNDKVRPVCLPRRSFPTGTNCYVTGWGIIDKHKKGGPSKLRQAMVPLVSRNECRKVHRPRITTRMICAGFINGSVDACAGDSGGPLVCKNRSGVWDLAGVVSFGKECPGTYGVYANVKALKGWIESTMSNVIDMLRYNHEGEAYKEKGKLQTYVKVDDLFNIMVEYRRMMDDIDRDYRDEEAVRNRLQKNIIQWIQDRLKECDKNGKHPACRQYELDLQTPETVETNKKALLEIKIGNEDDYYSNVGADEILEWLTEMVEPLDEQRQLIKDFISIPLKEAYGPLIDQVHSTLYHRLDLWFKDLYTIPYDIIH